MTITKINRPYFVEWLDRWRDKDIIKVVTGIRRCGKTTLFNIYREKLLAEGISPDQIVSINFEDPLIGPFKDFREAWKFVHDQMTAPHTYLFLDEVQVVPEFERMVDGFFASKDCDVYITGSNATFLSGELATFLTGRYVEIQMHPLSFAEYLTVFPNEHKGDLFEQYMRFGGFPFPALLAIDPAMQNDYLSAVLTTILYKDIFARKGIRDEALLKRLTSFIFDNIGNLLSVNKILGTFKSDGFSVQTPTLDAYLDALCESFLIYRVGRYDIRGRDILKTNAKYYIADPGLRRILLGDKVGDLGRILENIVFLELKRRYREVFVGTLGANEVDFVALENATPAYFQVALTVRDEATLARELKPLELIRDNHPKFLLTLDRDPPANFNGIKQLNVIDFLLSPKRAEFAIISVAACAHDPA